MKDRFVVVIGSYMIPTVVSVTKPKATIESKEFRMINHYYKYPGLVKWSPITITFVDGTGDIWKRKVGTTQQNGMESFERIKHGNLSASDLLAVMLAKTGYMTPDKDGPLKDFADKAYVNPAGITTPEKAATMGLAFGTGDGSESVMKIQQIDTGILRHPDKKTPEIQITEEWQLYNPIITEIDWGSLAYGDDGLVEYSMTIDYDYAKMRSANLSNIETRRATLGSYNAEIFMNDWLKKK